MPFVGQHEKAWGHGEAEGLGGLEVDDQLELHGLLHGHPETPVQHQRNLPLLCCGAQSLALVYL